MKVKSSAVIGMYEVLKATHSRMAISRSLGNGVLAWRSDGAGIARMAAVAKVSPMSRVATTEEVFAVLNAELEGV